MVTIDPNNYNKILAETTVLFQKYGALLIDTDKCAEEINVGKGGLENRRAKGKGIPYVKFGNMNNSQVRYRIDIIAAHKHGYNHISKDMCKKLLLDVLKTRPIVLYTLKETVALYDFEAQKMRRDLSMKQKRSVNTRKKRKLETYPLVAPEQSNEPGTNYQFNINNIVEHICELKYVPTVSWWG